MGTSRLSIIALVIFFVGGMILLRFVDVEAAQRAAREADAGFRAVPDAG
jgi:MFS-type transporter involved in bile tolerance (Atg22 family)